MVKLSPTVYVLVSGLIDHGETVKGVFSSIENIEKVVADIPRSYKRTPWIRVSPTRWQCKDEYLIIETMTLNENIWENIDKEFDELVDNSSIYEEFAIPQ